MEGSFPDNTNSGGGKIFDGPNQMYRLPPPYELPPPWVPPEEVRVPLIKPDLDLDLVIFSTENFGKSSTCCRNLVRYVKMMDIENP